MTHLLTPRLLNSDERLRLQLRALLHQDLDLAFRLFQFTAAGI